MVQDYTPRDYRELIEEELLRDLLERYPELMPVLDTREINVDAVAGRTLVEAATMHGFEPDSVVDEAIRIMSVERQ